MAWRENWTTTVMADFLTKEAKDIVQGSEGPLKKSAFSKLKSNKARYIYVRNKVSRVDHIIRDCKPSAKKCPLTAEMLKTEGNNAFLLHQYEKAHELFTLSAGYAIAENLEGSGSNILALSIANRSGALFWSGKYKEALIDIENALQFGYPEDLKYKLYDRKGKCYLELKAYRAAETAFRFAADLLEKSTLNDDKKKDTLIQIEEKIKVFSLNKSIDVEVDLNLKGKLPNLSDEPNKTHTSLSSACEVECRPGKGRCVVAVRDIKPGEVLMVEKPFATVLKPKEQYKDGCYNCFYPSLTLLPCLKCSKAKYCSIVCRDAAWESFHRYECGVPISDLIGEGTSEHLALKAILVAGLDRVLEFHENRSSCKDKVATKSLGCNEAGQYLSSDYAPVYYIEGSNGAVSLEFYFLASFTSVFLTQLLKKMGFFDGIVKAKKDTVMTYVGDSLISHLVSRSLNIAHGLDVAQGRSREMVAISLASTHALFNHSCDMETIATFYGTTAVLTSLKTFKQGQEVHINYCDSFAGCCKESRQMALEMLSFIKCSCEPCRKNWPLLVNLSNTPKMKCSQCEASLRGAERGSVKCPCCKKTQNVDALVESYNAVTKKLGDQPNNIDVQLEYIAAMDKVVVQPWRQSVACKGLIMRSLWEKGSYANFQYKE